MLIVVGLLILLVVIAVILLAILLPSKNETQTIPDIGETLTKQFIIEHVQTFYVDSAKITTTKLYRQSVDNR